ncbi:5597_t:CDS:10 [Cetraspora pellucida]|uniref:5597_t:CDS:1 n=1 Tax=Cetraspora pellucida TaxID=1433469 RepID=A0ACA9L5F5_9GLOM|nr:5597_t:CDS:10 [Cetraspora pellucida]
MDIFQLAQNKDKKYIHAFLKKCLERTNLEKEKTLDELSKCLRDSPSDYLPILGSIVSCLHSRNSLHINLVSSFINIIFVQNLQYLSDFPSFGVLLSRCVELLWKTDNTHLARLTTKRLFSAIIDVNCVMELLISESPSNRCLKRILFVHKMIDKIEREELFKAMEKIKALIDKCSEHDCSFSIETLRDHKCTEQQMKDSFRDLIESLPCHKCHKNALISFCPDKYSSPPDEENTDIESSKRLFRLPFEFDDNDKLGSWDVLLSENAIKDIQKLGPDMINAVMNKLRQISFGKWDKHGFRCVKDHIIPVYVAEVSNNVISLKILWQVDYGFSIRVYEFTQLVKVWAVAEKIDEILENLALAHESYTKEHSNKCTHKLISQDGRNLPIIFGGEETTKSSEDGLRDPQFDDEKLIEIHEMLVTNKFTPISKKFFQSFANGGSDFTFQLSKTEYEFINYPTSAIIIGRSGTGKTTSIVFRLIASYLTNKKRQLFITVSGNLRRSIKQYFNRLQESVMLADAGNRTTIKNEYTEQFLDENKIPDSFRLLEDEHFPLFITYDKFSKMLLGTYEVDVQKLIKRQKSDTDDEEETYFSFNSFDTFNPHFVDYRMFTIKYWPRLGDFYTQKLDCELVYSEFSVIRGTDPEIDYLSREEYRTISIKRYPSFCHDRDKIYDLFLRYDEMKSQNDDYDSADRTMAIFRYAQKHAFGGPQINEVYIDECQDNQIVDISLMLKLFDNANGIFLAGDIAQCIARGSSFRFQSVRSLMYTWELSRFERSLTNYKRHGTISPKQFELNINYRSHNQILQLASSVIDLIWHFFPDSIDKLSCERSEIGGPKPVVFCEVQAKDLFDNFSTDKQGEHVTNRIEFGAKQIIIVRDDEVKHQVEELIKDSGMVETVFNCKGMEFNDVILYNFFTNSPACGKWRVIHSALDKNKVGVPTFSHNKHCILCTELKQLYVAVTRGRRSIWIFDENAKYSEPIRTYWEQKGLIRISNDAKEITLFAKESSPEEWDEKGNEFLDKKNFRQKSGNEKLRNLANAYHLQQIARDSMNYSDNTIEKKKFTCAAQAFKTCAEPFLEASCYEEGEMYEEAISIYIGLEEYEHAARCYHKNNNLEKAGECLEKANKYTEAVLAYKNGKFYKKVIDLIERKKQEINNDKFDQVIRFVYFHYRLEKNEKMCKRILSVIETQDKRDELIIAYAQEVEIKEAKELRSCGKFEEAANMFIKTIKSYDNYAESLQCLLYLCRINALNVIRETVDSSVFEKLNKLYKKIDNIINEAKLKKDSSKKPRQWDSLIEEFQLYKAYLNNNLDQVYEYIKSRRDITIEFCAIIIWLKIPQQNIYTNYHYRLECLLRLYEISIPFMVLYDNVGTNHKDFENIFAVNAENVVNNLDKQLARILGKMNLKVGKVVEGIHEHFEKIFAISTMNNNPNNRKISHDNPLVHIIDECSLGKGKLIDNYWQVYKKNVIYHAILKTLSLYIQRLILKIHIDGQEFPDIAFEICRECALPNKQSKCQNPNEKRHHIKPTQLTIYKRLRLASLQYSAIHQLDAIRREFKVFENIMVLGNFFSEFEKFKSLQYFWENKLINKLIRNHYRYRTDLVISEIRDIIYDEFKIINSKIYDKFKYNNINDFATILKYLFVFIQLQSDKLIEFCDTVSEIKCNNEPIGNSKTIGNSEVTEDSEPIGNSEAIEHSEVTEDSEVVENSKMIGNSEAIENSGAIKDSEAIENFEATEDSESIENSEAIEHSEATEDSEVIEDSEVTEDSEAIEDSKAIGKKLSSFILSIYSKDTTHITFNGILEFIGYIVGNNKSVRLDSFEAFGDLTSLIELTTTLIFAIQSKNFDFCLPQSYLFNYLNPFKINLLSIQCDENASSIEDNLKKILNHVKNFFELLISTKSFHTIIILRLIQHLVLIGLNESKLMKDILDIFKYLLKNLYSFNFKKYIQESNIEKLVSILNNDLKIECDSLVIVQYMQGTSKFSNLERIVETIIYKDDKFYSQLRQSCKFI